MNNLLSIQQSFSNSLLYGQVGIERYFPNNNRLSLSIYKNAYHYRLQDTLAQDYPALANILGDEGFTLLVSEYINKYPSASFSLRTLGQHLPGFLSAESHYAKQPYLAELAAFEWQLAEIFDFADSPTAAIEDVNTIPAESWPQLRVKLHPTIKWLRLNWNIAEIYPTLKANVKTPDLVIYPIRKTHLIWRNKYAPFYRVLDSLEWMALKTMENGQFSELCLMLSKLSKLPENAPLEAATYLKSWLASGLIESINYN